ncbi:MAG: helix-turn-helix transcriptional regulator [Rhizobiales bacterium]|nr:helix-turn-helix transcriptional regulator [Hyphomicrobiales bacterium]
MSFTLCLTFTFITFTFARMTQLADRMKDLGIKDADLAQKVGCDRSMISKIRSGKAMPSLCLALAIGRETGISPEGLMPIREAAE